MATTFVFEYIWIDGTKPTPHVRSKTKIYDWDPDERDADVMEAIYEPPPIMSENPLPFSPPEWGFDGSSTGQASGHDSDCMLTPVCVVPDPLRPGDAYLVLCEVFNSDGSPSATNHRAHLRKALDERDGDPWVGFEQEYTMYAGHRALGWPERGYPPPQGPFYCGVGSDEIAGRHLAEQHMHACIQAGLNICGVNAEVMLGQWEFQVGPIDGRGNPLLISDHLWLARWLLYRMGEDYKVRCSLDCKPENGDWNGAGLHTNFSTRHMREQNGILHIQQAINQLEKTHREHIAVYGVGLEERLTGRHETCDINTFKSGVGDRTASVRIPLHVHNERRGYFEDRRPGANADPYRVSARLVESVCKAKTTISA